MNPEKGGGAGRADLDVLDGVDDEHVLEVLHGALHPVVEGGRPLGVLQVQLVDGLQLLLRFLQGFPATVGQRVKGIPLVADLLASRVDVVGVVVIQLAVDQAEGGETRCGRSGSARPARPYTSQALVQGDTII